MSRVRGGLLGLGLASAVLLGACTGPGGDDQAAPSRSAAGPTTGPTGVAAVAECLRDAGYAITFDERENAIGYEGAAGDMTTYEGAYRACRKQAGL